MEKRTPIQKSIVRHSLKEIDRHPFKHVAGPEKSKALQNKKGNKHDKPSDVWKKVNGITYHYSDIPY